AGRTAAPGVSGRGLGPASSQMRMRVAAHERTACHTEDWGPFVPYELMIVVVQGHPPSMGSEAPGLPPMPQDLQLQGGRRYTRYWCITINWPPSTRAPPTSLCDCVSIRNVCSPALPRMLEISTTPEDSSSLVTKFGPGCPGPLRFGSKRAGSW